MRFGISVYPEQESEQELEAYLRLAAKHGFTAVFTSMFSVNEPADRLKERFTHLAALIHELGMTLSVDANPMLFEELGAAADDLSIFHEIGVDAIRMDMPFGDERDEQLIQNPFGITIEFSTMMFAMLDGHVDWEDARGRVTACHNFYPQRYTGVSERNYRAFNRDWVERAVPVETFITSRNPQARGPWPVKDGLPTLEDTRDMPIDLQVRYLDLLGGAEVLLIGNEPATEEELASVGEVARMIEPVPGDPVAPHELSVENILKPRPGARRTMLRVDLEEGATELEREVLAYDNHADMGDGTEYMLRSRMLRMIYRGRAFTPRQVEQEAFHRGDVVVVNDNLKHYAGEVQVVLKDMVNDGTRNLVARVAPEERVLLGLIGPHTVFRLVPRA